MIGRYEILRKLGEGGMGIVFEAHDMVLHRSVALKVIRKEVDEYSLIPLRHEADLMARLNHPNILKVFDAELTGNVPFIAMEYAPGGSLDKRLNREPQPPRWAAQASETLARAVHYLHTEASIPGVERGIIHRDLKPHNVLLMFGGSTRPEFEGFKISDFGLAKDFEGSQATTTRAGVGTLAYMAPEQTMGGTDLTCSVDVYALGVILYEMLTGHTPFTSAKPATPDAPAGSSARRGSDLLAFIEQIRWTEPTPPSRLVPRLHRDLETICLKCLRKQPQHRYASAKDLADDLKRWLNNEPIEARRTPLWERAWLRCRRRPWQAALGAITGVAAVAVIALGINAIEQRQKQQLNTFLLDQEKETQRRIREQHNLAVQTLDSIRDLVQKGDLNHDVGRDRLNHELMNYYFHLDDSEANADKLALATFRLGEFVAQTSKKLKAREVFAKAQKQFETLTASQPTPLNLSRLASTHLEQAKLHSAQGDYREATPHFDQARKICADLSRLPGDDRRKYLLLEAEVHHERGLMLARQYDLMNSLKAYQQGLEIREQLARELDQQNRKDRDLELSIALARSHGYMGDVYRDLGQLREADREYWKSHRERELIYNSYVSDVPAEQVFRVDRTDPNFPQQWDDVEVQFARSWMNFANLQIQTRALSSAISTARIAFKHLNNLQVRGSRRTDIRIDMADAHNLIAELELLLGNRAEADAESNLALVDFEKLYKENDSEIRIQRGYTTALLLRASILVGAGGPNNKARDHLQAAGELLDKLKEDRNPGTYFLMAEAKSLACELHLPGASEDEAFSYLDKAVDSKFRDRHPEDLRDFPLFRCLKESKTEETRKRFDEVIKKMSLPASAIKPT